MIGRWLVRLLEAVACLLAVIIIPAGVTAMEANKLYGLAGIGSALVVFTIVIWLERRR